MKVGIIGCGAISQIRHIPEYANNPNATLVGYYDFVYERAKEMAEKYGGKAFASLEELLACDEIEAVSVCTANSCHAENTVAALRAKKHVLCEKPMATTREECEKMVEEAKKANKKLMIAQNQVFMQEHVKAKELLSSGEIGDVLTFATCFGHGGPDNWSIDRGTGNWFFDKKKSAFGTIADLGIHKTHLMEFLLDSEIADVKAMTATLDKKYSDGTPVDVEDNAICLYRMKNGVIGTMTASWTYYGGYDDNTTVIYGTRGIMKILDGAHGVSIYKKDSEPVHYDFEKQTNSGVIDAFVECVENGVEPKVSGESVLSSMNVIFSAIEDAKK